MGSSKKTRKDTKPEYNYHKTQNGNGVLDPRIAGGYEDTTCCCSLSQLKFSLYLFNILFFISGIVLVCIGLYTFLEKHPSLILLTSGLYDVSACILIFAGIIILIVAISGFCGLSRDNSAVILTFSVFLLLVFMGEIGAGVLAYLYKGVIVDHLGQNLKQIFLNRYGVEGFNVTTNAVDHLQIGLDCCGVSSFEDWQHSAWFNEDETTTSRGENLVPDSCCISPSLGCGVRDHPSNIRYSGCMDRVSKIASDHLVVIGAVALGICAIQLVGTIISCALHCRLRKVFV